VQQLRLDALEDLRAAHQQEKHLVTLRRQRNQHHLHEVDDVHLLRKLREVLLQLFDYFRVDYRLQVNLVVETLVEVQVLLLIVAYYVLN